MKTQRTVEFERASLEQLAAIEKLGVNPLVMQLLRFQHDSVVRTMEVCDAQKVALNDMDGRNMALIDHVSELTDRIADLTDRLGRS